MIGWYDAAVIGKQTASPTVSSGWIARASVSSLSGSEAGTLPRKELHEAAEQLTASQAGFIAVGEPAIEKGLDKALTPAAKVVKRTVDAIDRRNHQRAAGSAQELTLPEQSKAALSGVAFWVEVAQHRCALNGRYPRVSG